MTSYLYNKRTGEKKFIPPIDQRSWLDNGWSLTPPVPASDPDGESIAPTKATTEPGKVELNTAKVEDLLGLSIAPTKAKKILDGIPYASAEEAIAQHPELSKVVDRLTVIPPDAAT